jgi:hypothetical protein
MPAIILALTLNRPPRTGLERYPPKLDKNKIPVARKRQNFERKFLRRYSRHGLSNWILESLQHLKLDRFHAHTSTPFCITSEDVAIRPLNLIKLPFQVIDMRPWF